MTLMPVWHSNDDAIKRCHVHNECKEGKLIPIKKRIGGNGGKELCEECKK